MPHRRLRDVSNAYTSVAILAQIRPDLGHFILIMPFAIIPMEVKELLERMPAEVVKRIVVGYLEAAVQLQDGQAGHRVMVFQYQDYDTVDGAATLALYAVRGAGKVELLIEESIIGA